PQARPPGAAVKQRRRMTSDLLAIIDRRYFKGRPARMRGVAEATLNAEIAQEIYALRTKAGLTQKQLAEMIGTTGSVVSRLEDGDYDGHSLKMLQRIGAALNRRLEVRFAPMRASRKSA
ncbi:MAG: helix-turn-helix transcriptional regulator, partial [Candidatus Eisenbacteria bacterium]